MKQFTVPPFFYVKAFWESLSFVLAGLLGLLVVFEVLEPQYAVGAGALLTWFLAFLKFFNIEPELRERDARRFKVAEEAYLKAIQEENKKKKAKK
jgi:hypothetical protein